MRVKVNEHTANTITIGELRTGDFFKKENDSDIYIDVGLACDRAKPSIRAFNINTGEPEILYFDEIVIKKYDAYITVEEIPLEKHTYN